MFLYTIGNAFCITSANGVSNNLGLSNIYSNSDQKSKYAYVLFATKEAKEYFCNEYQEMLEYTKSKVVTLSLFPRYISTVEFERIISQTKDDTSIFKQISKYQYNADKILLESSMVQQYFDIETKDTISNILEIDKYDEKKFVIESKRTDFIDPKRNQTFKKYTI